MYGRISSSHLNPRDFVFNLNRNLVENATNKNTPFTSSNNIAKQEIFEKYYKFLILRFPCQF